MRTMIRKAGRTLSGTFLQGLAITLPITLTAALLYWLAVTTENFLGGLIQQLFPQWRYWPGLGIFLAVALVFLAGIVVKAWIAQQLVARVEALFERIPLVKSIYGSIRDIANFLSNRDSRTGFKQVVAVRITDGIRAIGFVTADDLAGPPGSAADAEPVVAVYLPMSYQIGGYTLYMPKSLLEPLDIPAEEAMRLILIAGMSSGRQKE